MNSDHFITDEEWEQADWMGQYEWAIDKVKHLACQYKARLCPTCKKDVGVASFEPDDPSVGIFGAFWYNNCPKHGEFTTDTEGKQTREDE